MGNFPPSEERQFNAWINLPDEILFDQQRSIDELCRVGFIAAVYAVESIPPQDYKAYVADLLAHAEYV